MGRCHRRSSRRYGSQSCCRERDNARSVRDADGQFGVDSVSQRELARPSKIAIGSIRLVGGQRQRCASSSISASCARCPRSQSPPSTCRPVVTGSVTPPSPSTPPSPRSLSSRFSGESLLLSSISSNLGHVPRHVRREYAGSLKGAVQAGPWGYQLGSGAAGRGRAAARTRSGARAFISIKPQTDRLNACRPQHDLSRPVSRSSVSPSASIPRRRAKTKWCDRREHRADRLRSEGGPGRDSGNAQLC